jgi:hypothetical protein
VALCHSLGEGVRVAVILLVEILSLVDLEPFWSSFKKVLAGSETLRFRSQWFWSLTRLIHGWWQGSELRVYKIKSVLKRYGIPIRGDDHTSPHWRSAQRQEPRFYRKAAWRLGRFAPWSLCTLVARTNTTSKIRFARSGLWITWRPWEDSCFKLPGLLGD